MSKDTTKKYIFVVWPIVCMHFLLGTWQKKIRPYAHTPKIKHIGHVFFLAHNKFMTLPYAFHWHTAKSWVCRVLFLSTRQNNFYMELLQVPNLVAPNKKNSLLTLKVFQLSTYSMWYSILKFSLVSDLTPEMKRNFQHLIRETRSRKCVRMNLKF